MSHYQLLTHILLETDCLPWYLSNFRLEKEKIWPSTQALWAQCCCSCPGHQVCFLTWCLTSCGSLSWWAKGTLHTTSPSISFESLRTSTTAKLKELPLRASRTDTSTSTSSSNSRTSNKQFLFYQLTPLPSHIITCWEHLQQKHTQTHTAKASKQQFLQVTTRLEITYWLPIKHYP